MARSPSWKWRRFAAMPMGVLAFACSSEPKDDTLYARLGKGPGVTGLVHSFVETLAADPRVNGYFLNASMDRPHFESCLVKQIGQAAGGPEKYDCAAMKAAHAGHGVSKHDFDDFMEDFRSALDAAKVSQTDADTLVAALSPHETDVVEDPTSAQTTYQRLGRKLGIQAIVTDFHARVQSDPLIGSFFTGVDPDRLAVCAVRQLCEASGGPCKYGDEIPNAEPPVVSACRTMTMTHAGLGITLAQMDAFVADLTAALNAGGIPAPDRDVLVSAVQGQCSAVVEVGTCP